MPVGAGAVVVLLAAELATEETAEEMEEAAEETSDEMLAVSVMLAKVVVKRAVVCAGLATGLDCCLFTGDAATLAATARMSEGLKNILSAKATEFNCREWKGWVEEKLSSSLRFHASRSDL